MTPRDVTNAGGGAAVTTREEALAVTPRDATTGEEGAAVTPRGRDDAGGGAAVTPRDATTREEVLP